MPLTHSFWAVYSPVSGTCQLGKLAYFFDWVPPVRFNLGESSPFNRLNFHQAGIKRRSAANVRQRL
jgi:hypothetical protein